MLEVRDLSGGHDGTRVLTDISISVERGEFLLLTGPNGSGKTTLVHHFNGLLEPETGRVLVDGKPVSADPVRARTAVGVVFQEPGDQFVAATVGADVAFGPENLGVERDEVDRRVEAALETVGMAGRETERIDALSGGERTRVALAGVLAMEPAYVILDEPLGSLDVHARDRLLDYLADLVDSGTAVVLVTHDLRDAWAEADRVVGLRAGRVEVDGPPEANRETLVDLAVVPRC